MQMEKRSNIPKLVKAISTLSKSDLKIRTFDPQQVEKMASDTGEKLQSGIHIKAVNLSVQ